MREGKRLCGEIRGNELVALKEIAELINTTNDMDRMLNGALSKLLQTTSFTAGWIFLFDDCGNEFCAVASNLPPALEARNQAAMCGDNCWCVDRYRKGKLHRAVNIIECSRIPYAADVNRCDTGGITHHATVPLESGKDRFGLLNVAEAGKERLSDNELELLQAVAYQIGSAIKRIRLYQAQERSALLYAKLGDVIQEIHSVQDIRHLPLRAVQAIGQAFDWPNVSLFVRDQQQLALQAQYANGQVNKTWQTLPVDRAEPVNTAFRENRLVIVSHCDEVASGALSAIGIPPFASAAAIPLRIRARAIGVLFVSSPKKRQFDEYHTDFMYSLGDHFSLSVENLRIYEQRSELARMEERNRVARDLHDSVMQKLFSLSFLAKGAETALGEKDPVVSRSLQEIRQLAQDTLKEMRSLIWQLHPAGLENGLLPALKQYAQAMDLTVYERAEGVKSLPRSIEEALWRIGQEALNNVKKHSGTNTAYIRLVKSDTDATLEIMDKGKGFSSGKKKGKLTMGMRSMRERAEALGGSVTFTGGHGQPTVVKATIPIHVIEEKCCEERE
jgi:hypothetical protein